MKSAWPFAFNVFFFATVAFVMPYLVLFYQSLGFSGAQIGLITGVTPLVTLVSAPFWTGLADARRWHRLIMGGALLAAAGALFLFPLLNAFVPILVIAIIYACFAAPSTAFADSAAMTMLGERRDLYGRIRLGGTIGFGLTAPLAGRLVEQGGLRWAFWGGALWLLLALLVSQKLRFNPARATAHTQHRAGSLLLSRRWQLFLLLAGAGGMASAIVNNYLFPYMKELGAQGSIMGLALTMGTLAEVPVLFFGNRLLRRLRPQGLLLAALVVAALRLLALAAASTPQHILLVQLLNGFAFPAMWVAGVAYAHENAAAEMSATAQGMWGAMVFGFGAAVGGFSGGLLFERLGGQGMYLACGCFVLAVVVVAGLLLLRLPVAGDQP